MLDIATAPCRPPNMVFTTAFTASFAATASGLGHPAPVQIEVQHKKHGFMVIELSDYC